MASILIILVCLSSATEPAAQSLFVKRQAYKKQIGINGLISAGLTASAGIYLVKGNSSYDKYQNSMTTADALHYWERTQNCDRIRNICAIGALLFIGRTIFYYAKYMDAGKSLGKLPSLDLRYTQRGTVSLGITQIF